MKRTNIYLDDEQTTQLDQLAASEGISRAELIRRFLDRALHSRDDDLASDLAAIDNSFGALRDLAPLPRGDDERSEHLARLWRLSS